MSKSILFCTGIFPPDIGGPATYVLKMTKKMSEGGIRNAIITYSNGESGDNFGLEVFRIKRSNFILNYIKYFFKVLQIGKKFDVLYLQGSFSEGIPTVLANVFLRKKLKIRIGGIFAWEYCVNNKLTKTLPEEFYSKKQDSICEFFKFIDRFIISRCCNVLANSNYMKKLLILNKVNGNKISVIHNIIDLPSYPTLSRNFLLKKFNLPDKKIILSHGRFVSWKNFEQLIDFVNGLDFDYLLVIAGDGPEKNKLLASIRKQNLQNVVTVLGKQSAEDIYYLNKLCDIFVLISSYEGLSNALIEAMQQKCSIIASNIESNIEVLENYKNCKIIDINKEEFLEAVYLLEKNKTTEGSIDFNKYNQDSIYKETLRILCE